MSAIFATATFIAMVVVPLLILAVLIALIGCGGVVLLQGLVSKKLVRSALGALLLMAGLGAGFTLTNWATIQPAPGESSAVHVLVFENWQKIRVRFWARAAKAGENAERPSESQQQPAN